MSNQNRKRKNVHNTQKINTDGLTGTAGTANMLKNKLEDRLKKIEARRKDKDKNSVTNSIISVVLEVLIIALVAYMPTEVIRCIYGIPAIIIALFGIFINVRNIKKDKLKKKNTVLCCIHAALAIILLLELIPFFN